MNTPFLQALYKWSVENSDSQVLKNTSPDKLMSPEKRKWLEEAFSALIKDGYTLMQETLNFMTDEKTSDGDRIVAMASLEELLENIDNSANFHKLNGWDIIIGYAKSPNRPLASAAMSCIAAGLQNHPDATLKAIESGIMSIITRVSTTPFVPEEEGFANYVRASAALVSSLLRSNMDVRIETLTHGAHRVLVSILSLRPICAQLQQRTLHVLNFLSAEEHVHEDRRAKSAYDKFKKLLWTQELRATLTRYGADVQMVDEPVLRTNVEAILRNIGKR